MREYFEDPSDSLLGLPAAGAPARPPRKKGFRPGRMSIELKAEAAAAARAAKMKAIVEAQQRAKILQGAPTTPGGGGTSTSGGKAIAATTPAAFRARSGLQQGAPGTGPVGPMKLLAPPASKQSQKPKKPIIPQAPPKALLGSQGAQRFLAGLGAPDDAAQLGNGAIWLASEQVPLTWYNPGRPGVDGVRQGVEQMVYPDGTPAMALFYLPRMDCSAVADPSARAGNPFSRYLGSARLGVLIRVAAWGSEEYRISYHSLNEPIEGGRAELGWRRGSEPAYGLWQEGELPADYWVLIGTYECGGLGYTVFNTDIPGLPPDGEAVYPGMCGDFVGGWGGDTAYRRWWLNHFNWAATAPNVAARAWVYLTLGPISGFISQPADLWRFDMSGLAPEKGTIPAKAWLDLNFLDAVYTGSHGMPQLITVTGDTIKLDHGKLAAWLATPTGQAWKPLVLPTEGDAVLATWIDPPAVGRAAPPIPTKIEPPPGGGDGGGGGGDEDSGGGNEPSQELQDLVTRMFEQQNQPAGPVDDGSGGAGAGGGGGGGGGGDFYDFPPPEETYLPEDVQTSAPEPGYYTPPEYVAPGEPVAYLSAEEVLQILAYLLAQQEGGPLLPAPAENAIQMWEGYAELDQAPLSPEEQQELATLEAAAAGEGFY